MGEDNQILCKGCGVRVTPGYPKCPRCGMPQEKVQNPIARAADHGAAPGGTSVVSSDSSGAWQSLIVVLALVALGIGGYFLLGKSKESGPAPTLPTDEAAKDTTPQAAVPLVDPNQTPEIEEPDKDEVARKALQKDFEKKRLWGKSSVKGTTLVWVSSLCEDPELMTALAEHEQALRAAGLTLFQCRAKHGEILLEHKL